MKGIIYCAINKRNNKRYIGQTIQDLKERQLKHFTTNNCPYFHKAILKNGQDSFEWKIIDSGVQGEDLDRKEKFWIAFFETNNHNKGYEIRETETQLEAWGKDDAELLGEFKQAKINKIKYIRDTEEVKPIEYNGNLFDFDDKARDRINSAIIALSITSQSIEWTTADNINVLVTVDDLRGIVANVAVRSNELHVKYRELKERVENCTTKEELDSIKWDEENNV